MLLIAVFAMLRDYAAAMPLRCLAAMRN